MKTRTVRRTRQVPVALADGRTRTGTQTYYDDVPVPPRDWDHAILTAATVAAALFLTACVVWTTASVGALLAEAVPAWAAYAVAGGFDLVWIICLGLEWVARYDDARAATPRKAGLLFLAISMAAVGVHGWLVGNLAVGVIGALVSLLAKGAWTVVMGYHKTPLPEPVQDVLAQERAELGLELALAAHQRQALRTRGQLAAYRATLAASMPDIEVTQEPPEGADGRAEGTIRAAVRAAQSTLPDADPAAIVTQLGHAGITVDEDTVRAIVGPPPQGDAHVAPPVAVGVASTKEQADALTPASKSEAITDAATRLGQGATASDIAAYVQRNHGLAVEPNAVRAVLSRAKKTRSTARGAGKGEGGYW